MKTPRITGSYTPIYQPDADLFPGPDSLCFRAGQFYMDWIPNDHCFIKDPDCHWHLFGITHPAPPDYLPPDRYNPETIHDGEWQLFHAKSPVSPFSEILQPASWVDQPKILEPAKRPAENKNIYAPHIVHQGNQYFMFYGPGPIRLATSSDLEHWQAQGPCFNGPDSSRDPHILRLGDRYLMTYVAENQLLLRQSDNLLDWGPAKIIYQATENHAPESPSMVFYENLYYLFWCMWDGQNGPYDDRTYVFCSDNPFDFQQCDPICMLQAHAPEIICDEKNQWYISSAEKPYRGVSLAPLSWM